MKIDPHSRNRVFRGEMVLEIMLLALTFAFFFASLTAVSNWLGDSKELYKETFVVPRQDFINRDGGLFAPKSPLPGLVITKE